MPVKILYLVPKEETHNDIPNGPFYNKKIAGREYVPREHARKRYNKLRTSATTRAIDNL